MFLIIDELFTLYIIYWVLLTKSISSRNILLLVASYFFYAKWDLRFLLLLILLTLLNFALGPLLINKKIKKNALIFGLIINIGSLVVFKYFNFFIDSLNVLIDVNIKTLNIVIPIGISFYTFHSISYLVDVYKEKILPEKNLIAYSVFISFFPLLIAGPIERATTLLPQIAIKKQYSYQGHVNALRQILWGLVKKIIIANNCALYVDKIFENYSNLPGSTLFIGAIFYSIQIYTDFSAYSDIAIGSARLFGIDLIRNFNFPYFSRDIAEFWRRWHISLSSWFRDYLYIPLGGSKGNKFSAIRNTFIIFIVSGFWHGANWTFICWGLLNALYFLPLLVLKRNRNNLEIVATGKLLPSLSDALKIIMTNLLVIIGWIFFRSENLIVASNIFKKIFSLTIFTIPSMHFISNQTRDFTTPLFIFIILLFFLVEWVGRENNFAIEKMFHKQHLIIRYSFYFILISGLIYLKSKDQAFIYFQF